MVAVPVEERRVDRRTEAEAEAEAVGVDHGTAIRAARVLLPPFRY